MSENMCIHEFDLHEASGIRLCKHCGRMERKIDRKIAEILSDDTPVGPEDEADIALFRKAISDADDRLSRRKALWEIMFSALEHKTYSELRLINADLLDALKYLRAVMANHDDTPEEILAIDMAERVIAKAEGGAA